MSEILEAGNSIVFLSIVVTSKNDKKLISCIESASQMLHLDRAELIIVLNGSDKTYTQEAEHYTQSLSMNLQLIGLPVTQTIAFARNTGARAAQSDFIAFVDSDCLFDEEYVGEAISALEHHPIVAGKIIFVPINSWFSRLNSLQRERYFTSIYCTYVRTPNLLIRRPIFNKIGGFEETLAFGEDFELNQRCFLAGIDVFYEESVQVQHCDDETWKKTVKNWFRNGIGGAYRFKRSCKLRGKSAWTFYRHLYRAVPEVNVSWQYTMFVHFCWLIHNLGFIRGLCIWRTQDIKEFTFTPIAGRS